MPTSTAPDIATLKKALGIAEQIEKLETELRSLLNGSSAPEAVARPALVVPTAPPKARKKKRVVSPESRAKMAAAQRARWAKKNAAAGGEKP